MLFRRDKVEIGTMTIEAKKDVVVVVSVVAVWVICFGDTEEYRELRLRNGESEHSATCRRGGTTRGSLHSAAYAPVLA